MVGEVSRDAMPGSFVLVLGKEGTPFGWGLWNPKSRMPLRIVSHSLEEIDDETFFENAIRRAAQLRRGALKLDAGTDSYRAIHGDADFMPGIVADKFADVLSVEITNLAAWQRLPKWLPLLHECFDTKRVVVSVDAKDGLVAVKGWLETSAVQAVDLAAKVWDAGVRTLIYTDITRDGTLEGLDAPPITVMRGVWRGELIAGGGVRDADDLKLLETLGVEGAIVGRSLYEGTLRYGDW